MAKDKWRDSVPLIQSMIGVASTHEIAAELHTTVNNLHKICHRHGVLLPRDPDSYRGGRKKAEKKGDIEAAKDLLISKGYRVLPPDPFRKVQQ